MIHKHKHLNINLQNPVYCIYFICYVKKEINDEQCLTFLILGICINIHDGFLVVFYIVRMKFRTTPAFYLFKNVLHTDKDHFILTENGIIGYSSLVVLVKF